MKMRKMPITAVVCVGCLVLACAAGRTLLKTLSLGSRMIVQLGSHSLIAK